MDFLFKVEWKELFVPHMSLPEILIRGTIIYLLLLFFLHAVRKQSGGISISDLLVIVLLGNAAQNALVSDTISITDGVLLATVIIGWSWIFDYLAVKSSHIRRFLHPKPRILMRDGNFNRKNMRREMITEEELRSQLREEGVNDLSKVDKVYLEGDGHFSVIKKEE